MAPETDESLKNDVTTHFEFGENWAAYAQTISTTRIEQAQTGLLNLFAAEDIRQATFLDIGCGSGLHALAALNLGAGQVTGIDIDPNSVATTQHTLKQYATRNAYECRVGNIFDPPFTPDQRFDIVYSWGVLHHTGSMWEAIDNAIKLVAPGGKLAIAIYVKTRFCGFWKAEKKLYTRLPKLLRLPIIWLFSALCFLRVLTQGKNPFKFIADYETFRGMSWYHDRIDWLGGYPYESASREEIVDFVAQRGGRLIKAIGTQPSIGLLGTGCAEYVFEFSAT